MLSKAERILLEIAEQDERPTDSSSRYDCISWIIEENSEYIQELREKAKKEEYSS
jgi:hypothetical protein